jgi:hypothetical protein
MKAPPPPQPAPKNVTGPSMKGKKKPIPPKNPHDTSDDEEMAPPPPPPHQPAPKKVTGPSMKGQKKPIPPKNPHDMSDDEEMEPPRPAPKKATSPSMKGQKKPKAKVVKSSDDSDESEVSNNKKT